MPRDPTGSQAGRNEGTRANGHSTRWYEGAKHHTNRDNEGVDTPVAPRAAGPQTITRPEVESDTSVAPDLPWVVIVWNDPINLMSWVTFVFQKLFGYSLERATELMLDVHHKGKAVVSSGNREKAEMDGFRLHEHGLWATMEKDGAESDA